MTQFHRIMIFLKLVDWYKLDNIYIMMITAKSICLSYNYWTKKENDGRTKAKAQTKKNKEVTAKL